MRVDGIDSIVSLGINADFDTEATHFQGMVRTDIDNFILDITNTDDESVSPYLQRFPGEETARVARWGISSNLKMSNWLFLNGIICRAKSLNSEANNIKVATVDDTNGYAVPSITAEQETLWKTNTLLWGFGFTDASNNGLKVLSTDVSAGDTNIAVTETLSDETNSNGRLYYGGYRIPAATSKTWTWDPSNRTATLAVTGIGNIPGIYRGMSVVIGSYTNNNVRQNALTGTNANDAYGLVTIREINTDSIEFYDIPTELQITQTPTTDLDLRYSVFARPWVKRHTNFVAYWLTAERQIPQGDVGDLDNFKYMLHSQLSSATIGFTPGTHTTFNIEGLGTDQRVANARTAGVTAEDPFLRRVYSPSKGLGRTLLTRNRDNNLKMTNIVEGTITYNVNATPFNAVGFTGALDIVPGVIDVDGSITVTYTDSSIDTDIENSELFNIKVPFMNPQGAIIHHFPSMQLVPTSENHPRDGKITYGCNTPSYVDPVYDTSALLTTIMGPVPIGRNVRLS